MSVKMVSTSSLIPLLVLLLSSSWATGDDVNPEDGAAPGHYEMYVFAMEWQPNWSAGSGCEPLLAAHLSPSSWAATHLSIHGLWPNYNASLHGGYTWPQYCVREAEGEDYTQCEADIQSEPYCFPAAAASVYNTSNGPWQTHALEYSWSSPADCFSCHEWSKHGSCTNWTSSDYFSRSEQMYALLSEGSGFKYLGESIGATVPLSELRAAFEEDTGGKAVAFNCGDGCALSEVWTAWEADPVTLEPGAPTDYPGDDPCGACDEVSVAAWTMDDGACPPTAVP